MCAYARACRRGSYRLDDDPDVPSEEGEEGVLAAAARDAKDALEAAEREAGGGGGQPAAAAGKADEERSPRRGAKRGAKQASKDEASVADVKDGARQGIKACLRNQADGPEGAGGGSEDDARKRARSDGGGEDDAATAAAAAVEDKLALEHAPDTPRASSGSQEQCSCSFEIVAGCAAERGQRPYMEDRHAVHCAFVLEGDGDGGRHGGEGAAKTHVAAGCGAVEDDTRASDAQVAAASADSVARSYLAVFDGHNGTRAAEYAAAHMHEAIAADDALARARPAPMAEGELRAAERRASGEGAALQSRLQMPALPLCAHSTLVNDDVAVALRRAFLKVDAEILHATASGGTRDGATALVALRWGEWLYTANAGDCRAVLVRMPEAVGGDGACGQGLGCGLPAAQQQQQQQQASAMRLTTDHKPDLPAERARVEAAGGSVQHLGVWRVRHTSLPVAVACSRTLGDLDFKQPAQLLTADPEVRRVRLDRLRGDCLVLIASDGLFDVLDDATAAAIALRELQLVRVAAAGAGSSPSGWMRTPHGGEGRRTDQRAAQAAARALVRGAITCGSADNVTAVAAVIRWNDAAATTS